MLNFADSVRKEPVCRLARKKRFIYRRKESFSSTGSGAWPAFYAARPVLLESCPQMENILCSVILVVANFSVLPGAQEKR